MAHFVNLNLNSCITLSITILKRQKFWKTSRDCKKKISRGDTTKNLLCYQSDIRISQWNSHKGAWAWKCTEHDDLLPFRVILDMKTFFCLHISIGKSEIENVPCNYCCFQNTWHCRHKTFFVHIFMTIFQTIVSPSNRVRFTQFFNENSTILLPTGHGNKH